MDDIARLRTELQAVAQRLDRASFSAETSIVKRDFAAGASILKAHAASLQRRTTVDIADDELLSRLTRDAERDLQKFEATSFAKARTAGHKVLRVPPP